MSSSTQPVQYGPLPFDEEQVEAFRSAPSAAGDGPGAPTDIVIFGEFGQLHAGPSRVDMPSHATHRQLMVLRMPTKLASP